MSDRIDDEIEAITAIYGCNCIMPMKIINKDNTINITKELTVMLDDSFTCRFIIPSEYPETASPLVEFKWYHGYTVDERSNLNNEINQALIEGFGNEVLFTAIELLREFIEKNSSLDNDFSIEKSIENEIIPNNCFGINNNNNNNNNINNNTTTTTNNNANEYYLNVIHGEKTCEKQSHFQSHFANINTIEELQEFRNVVLSDKKCQSASHNILAYRFTCPNTGVLYHDYDDDGESAAGGRLAEMLRLMGVENVVIIVTRWFGGTLLGPDRFKYICNSARLLLESHGYGKNKNNNKNKSIKIIE